MQFQIWYTEPTFGFIATQFNEFGLPIGSGFFFELMKYLAGSSPSSPGYFRDLRVEKAKCV